MFNSCVPVLEDATRSWTTEQVSIVHVVVCVHACTRFSIMIYGFGRIYEELKSIEENEFNFKEEVVCV